MRRLLCISGKRFSGKDTLAAALQKAAAGRGQELALYAFADESKRLFAASRPGELELERLLSDRAYKEKWRPALTEFTVASLAADPQIFVRSVAGRVIADTRPALITDLRLRLEVDYLRPRFLLTIARLQRSDAARAASGWVYDAAKDTHYTETELDDPALWTTVVDNDGDRAALTDRAAMLLDAYLG